MVKLAMLIVMVTVISHSSKTSIWVGLNSVRGYETSAIGPRATDPQRGEDFAVGGTKRLLGNVELYFPIPGMKDSKQLRLSTFIDVGSVWGETGDDELANGQGCNSTLSDCLRYSTGVGVSWFSPFGPIKLVFAKALNEQEGDRTQVLQFQLGTQF